ncbi:type IV pilin-like G/H family protein [Nostoc sp.]|uniref:type IV pilin-like G/H family protein n=1 Tax=Nostoc sp. TaxID=1180 RepID=UPI002FF602CF
MNRQLQPKGITVKTNLTSGCLMVIAESENEPEQSFVVDFIRNGITELKAEVIKRVVLHGRITGKKTPLWRESFEMHSNVTPQQEESESINSKINISISEGIASFLNVVQGRRELINTVLLLGIMIVLTTNLFTTNKSRPIFWEYKIESINDVVFDATMDRMGSNGWELTSARRALSGEGSSSQGLYEVILKRPTTEAQVREKVTENDKKREAEFKEFLLQTAMSASEINIVSINHSQQANYLEKKAFINTIEELGLDLKSENKDYFYNLTADSSNSVVTATAKIDELKSYTGAVFLVQENGETTTVAVICETNAPSKTPPQSPQLNGNQLACPAGSSKVE